MAGTDRKTTDHLAELTGALQAKPYKFGFYQVLRSIECLYTERPRLGASLRPVDDPIRLAQEPAMTFEAASLTAFEPGTDGKPHRLMVRLLGLLGPNGPLPLHLTEYALERKRDHGDRTFARFLDVFHHRMLSLFYRAWANNEPTVSFDRPEADRFADYVGSLVGLGMPALRKRDDIPDYTKFYYSGRLSGQTKCADGLQAVLADYFDLRAGIEEFVGEWMRLPQQHICRLGADESNGTLGQSVILGSRVWGSQYKFRITLGPLSIEEYMRLLPAGDRIRRLVALVRNYVGDELAWDVKLILNREEVPPTRLDGNTRLGWTTWLGERVSEKDADDLVLDACGYVIKQPARVS
ncbi:MAG: type VI secretion system baseplate subunit TssG [Planctomycetota bacterium]|jgi:type VI secretion system protein ImpH